MPSRAQSQANKWDFVEFWIDPGCEPPYALLLLGKHKGASRIVDPAENYKIVYVGNSYQDAKLWLLEDEYERVEGRLAYKDIYGTSSRRSLSTGVRS